jgi:hypothetical protein
MNVKRADLLLALQSVQPGLCKPGSLDGIMQGSCFTFAKGRVRTFNEQLSCSMPSGLGKELVAAVEGAPVLELLGKMTEEEIDVSVKDSKLSVTGKRRRVEFNMEADVQLPVEEVEKPGEWKPLHPDFCQAVNVVKECCGKDDQRLFIGCVHIHTGWVEARDASQLCRWPMETGVSEPTMVKANAIKAVTHTGVSEFSETGGWLHFRNPETRLTMSCRRHLDEFPDMSAQLKVSGEKVSFPKGLVEELDKAKVFSKDNEIDRVLVELSAGKVKLTGWGPYGKYEAWPKIKHEGRALSFLAVPDVLADVIKNHAECHVSEDKLKVKAEKFTYVCCLSKVSTKEEKDAEE